MSKNDNYQKLASQMIEMWQENIATMMNDTDLLRVLLDSLHHNPFAKTNDFNASTQKTGRTFHDAGAGNDSLARLEQRVAYLEKRITHLESTADGAQPKKRTAKAAAKPVHADGKRAKSGTRGGKRIAKKTR